MHKLTTQLLTGFLALEYWSEIKELISHTKTVLRLEIIPSEPVEMLILLQDWQECKTYKDIEDRVLKYTEEIDKAGLKLTVRGRTVADCKSRADKLLSQDDMTADDLGWPFVVAISPTEEIATQAINF